MATNFPASPSVDDTFTSSGVTYKWDGTVWKATGSGEFVATVTTGDTAPTSPQNGDLWYRTSDNRTYLYYDDSSSQQWVDVSPSLVADSDTFQRSGTNVTLVNSGDNVGIGASSPTVALDVAGEIRASTGILFGTDTAAANTLDDYEEGTWTPTFVGATTAGSYTFTSSSWYVKIGNMVTAYAKLRDITDVSLGSGQLNVGGLPFANGGGAEALGSCLLSSFNLAADAVSVTAFISPSESVVKFFETRDNAALSGLQVTDRTLDSADLYLEVAYNVG